MAIIINKINLDCFCCLFQRGSNSIYHGGVSIGAELLGKSDDNIEAEDQRNPCSLANRVADLLGSFISNSLDITCGFLLSTMASIVIFFNRSKNYKFFEILITQSKEFVDNKESFYFPLLLVVFNLIISYFSSLFGVYFEIFDIVDSPVFATKQARFQVCLTAFFEIFIISFVPFGCFSEKFSILTAEYHTSKEPLTNLTKENISFGWIIFCLFAGYLLEKALLVIFEYFSSHYYSPVNNMIKKCENGPCLNLISSNVLSYFAYPLAFLFISFTIFLCYGVLGFQGVGFALLGLISNIIPCYCVFSLGSLCSVSFKLGNLIRISQNSAERLYNISWASKNWCTHLYAILYGILILGGLAGCGAIFGFLNNENLIKVKTLQIFGAITGFVWCYFLNGFILSGVQSISQSAVLKFFKNN